MSEFIEQRSLRNLILAQATQHGARHYLEDARSARCSTYSDLVRDVGAWGQALDDAAIAIGASVLLDITDPLMFAVAYLGVIASGRCAVPLDPNTPDGEAARAIGALTPALVISDRDARATATGVPHLPAALTDSNLADPPLTDPPLTDPAMSGSVRLRTSGSTGDPKIVELSERQLLHVARGVAAHNGLTPADRGYNPLPLFHINAEVVGLLATLVAGSTLVLDRGFHRTRFWELVEERRITWINAVPAILSILAREQIPPRPPALRLIRSASAPLPGAVKARLVQALGDIVIESYGMTEAASQITVTATDSRSPSGSAGRPVGVELQIRTEGDEMAPAGEIGRIWIKGDGVISSYVGGRAADRFDAGGWLDTGDLGHLDEAGRLYLAGRADDVINRGGEMVYPREIEEVLMGDGRVLDAVAVGRPDEILGSVPVVYVIARNCPPTLQQQEVLIAELEQLCAEQLSRFKRPARLTLVDELPRAPTGKVRRHEVRRDASPHHHAVTSPTR